MVDKGAVKVASVHNYCPVPIGAAMGHPELFTFADSDYRVRENAVRYTSNTIEFAAELGATRVVMHCGNAKMPSLTRKLIGLWEDDLQFTEKYEKLKLKLLARRDKKVAKVLPYLYQCLEQMLPLLEKTGVALCLENLPTWEAIPTETEAEALFKHFDSPHIRYWHDIGHGQIRHNLGFINHIRWFERLRPYLAGMHVHDVRRPAMDHLAPSQGTVKFDEFTPYLDPTTLGVLEPSQRVTTEELRTALDMLRKTWGTP
jgi:sugar phosphate isomerase/epimerase